MKRKLLISLLSVACASCCAFGLAACSNSSNGNTPGDPSSGKYPDYVRPEVNEDTKLAYELNEGGTYTITGIGQETKTDIKIPAKIGDIDVTEIGKDAFIGSNLTKVVIDDGITTIGESAFTNCVGIKSLRIPSTVTTVGESAFQGCTNLIGVSLGNGLTNIPANMFQSCVKIKSITIPDSVTSIGESAFQSCENLTNIEMGKGVLTIGSRAFYNCASLVNVEVGESVTRLGDSVFENCSSLKNIVIPNSVRFIGTNLLYGCVDANGKSMLESITVPYVGAFRYNDPPEELKKSESDNSGEQEDDENKGPYPNIKIDDPSTYGHFGYYFGAASNGDNRARTEGIIKNVTVIITGDSPITNGSFNDLYGVTTVIIKGDVTQIMSQAFGMVWELTTIVVPKSLKNVDNGAFAYTTSLQTVYFDGTQSDWNSISIDSNQNDGFRSARRYYYSYESQNGCWHYDENGLPQPW